MTIKSFVTDCVEFVKRSIFLISWISLVLYLFCDTFIYYKYERQYNHLRRILGLGLCISRGTATVLNLCGALILLPLCKKLNQIIYRILSRLWPSLFFFWVEKAKGLHMTFAITLVFFAVIHSISHFVNLWNFSRGFDEECTEINFANYKNENPLLLLLSVAGMTGIIMLMIILSMGFTSMRVIRRRAYNAFWYTHQLYLLFILLFIIHPLSGVLKEEVIQNDSSLNPSHIDYWTSNNSTLRNTPRFIAIKSKTWLWMSVPLSCFFLDILWRVLTRNRAFVDVIVVNHMAGGTISLTMSCPHEEFVCRMGQYVLLQCPQLSLIEWHPFTVVKVPTSCQRNFVVWIRVKGDWTEALEKLFLEKGPRQLTMLVDGPFPSPMQGAGRSAVAICVAAGVGITPFVSMLHHMLLNPRSRNPGRIHLLWIVRHEQELSWLADLANKTIAQLRNANRPDRLHLELYVTYNHSNGIEDKEQNAVTHMVVINENGCLTHVLNKNDANCDTRATLLTPHIKMKRNFWRKNMDSVDNKYNIAKEYPLLGCRVRRGRPHWDRVFGYWVHLYPEAHLNLYCCGPKKLVKLLRNKCIYTSGNTKTKFTFVHEGFS